MDDRVEHFYHLCAAVLLQLDFAVWQDFLTKEESLDLQRLASKVVAEYQASRKKRGGET